MKKQTVTFIDNRNGKIDFNIRKGSNGPDVVDLTIFFLKQMLGTILVLHPLLVVHLILHILTAKRNFLHRG